MEGYDAVTLSTREMGQGFPLWEQAAKDGAPIVVANLYKDARRKKTVFKPYVIKKDHGHTMAVIGLLTETAWRAMTDTTVHYGYRSPVEMGKLIAKVAKQSDHLTVIGDFSAGETDSLVAHFPQIDLVVSSGIKSAERARTIGNTVVIGSSNRGYFGNYVDFAFDKSDSTRFHPSTQTLDESIPVDSTIFQFVNTVNQNVKTVANQPATPANQQ